MRVIRIAIMGIAAMAAGVERCRALIVLACYDGGAPMSRVNIQTYPCMDIPETAGRPGATPARRAAVVCSPSGPGTGSGRVPGPVRVDVCGGVRCVFLACSSLP